MIGRLATNLIDASCRGIAARHACRCVAARLIMGALFLSASGVASAAGGDSAAATRFPLSQVFTLLFLMLGPFKIIGPFATLTKGADAALTRRIAVRATLIATAALLIAALLGETILARYGVPLHVLSLSAGIILFLVALRTIFDQYESHKPLIAVREEERALGATRIAMSVAFPAIVTPHGVAALVVFLALSPNDAARFSVGAAVTAIMVLNLAVMLVTRRLLPVLAIVLPILGAVLSVVQVALGLQIVFFSLQAIRGL